MAKKIEISYDVDVKDDVKAKRQEILKVAGRFWEHAIPQPTFSYELDVGDVKKAKAIGALMKLLLKKGSKFKKVGQKIVTG